MITLLEKFFIKDGMSLSEKRERYGVLCGGLGIVLNIILCIFKFFAGFISGSVSIMADSANNLSDAGSSIVTLIGFKLAGQKPDSAHPYGHGRMEYISGFAVSATILAVGLGLMKESVSKIISPTAIEFSMITAIILAVSILVKAYMAFYNHAIGNRISSTTIKAVAKDSMGDCIATFVVLLSAYVSHYKGVNLDGYCGLAVSLLILYAGYSSIREAIDPLLGIPPEQEFLDKIREIVTTFDENIVGYHDLMVHDYGPGRRIISLHAEVPANEDMLKLHDIIDLLENKLYTELSCVTTIHMDPVVTDNPKVNELKARVAETLLEIDERITIHDFRVVWGDTHTNVIFDMVVPFSCSYTDAEAADIARRLIHEKISQKYFAVIMIDRGDQQRML